MKVILNIILFLAISILLGIAIMVFIYQIAYVLMCAIAVGSIISILLYIAHRRETNVSSDS